jgi:hypothetical protein
VYKKIPKSATRIERWKIQIEEMARRGIQLYGGGYLLSLKTRSAEYHTIHKSQFVPHCIIDETSGQTTIEVMYIGMLPEYAWEKSQ